MTTAIETTRKAYRCETTCRGVALENVNTNALDAGCIPPEHGFWLESDAIPEWSVTSISALITDYLIDGTSTHYCED